MVICMEKMSRHSEIIAARSAMVLALDGTLLEADEGLLQLTGYTRDEISEHFQNHLSYLVYVEDIEAFPSAFNRSRFATEILETEFRLLKKDGEQANVFLYGLFTKHVGYGEVIRCVCVDVTGSRQAGNMLYNMREELRVAEEKYRILADLQGGIGFEYDIASDVLDIFGTGSTGFLQESRITDATDRIRKDRFTGEEDKLLLLKLIEERAEGKLEFCRMDQNGESRWWKLETRIIYDAAGKAAYMLGSLCDINDQKKEELLLEQGGYKDVLTGLNRKESARKQIEEYLQENRGRESRHAMMIVDVDDMNMVNERLGQKAGNAILKNLAESMKGMFRGTDIIARIGGDQFLLFMKDIPSVTAVMDKVHELNEVFASASLNSSMDRITCSIGIARYPMDGLDFVELLFFADKALHYAKSNGGNSYLFYDRSMMEAVGDFRTPEEIYEEYHLLPSEEGSITKMESELVGFALDVLNDARNTHDAIYLILDQIGRVYDVTNVSILECDKERTRLGLTYYWDERYSCSRTEEYRGIGYDNYPGYEACFDRDGIYVINDMKELGEDQPGLNRTFAEKSGIQSILQCAIYEEGVLKGCISLHDTGRSHEWSRKEQMELSMTTKVIATHLLRMRANDEVQAQLERIENYDPLTGLPTQARFKKNVKEYLENHPDKQYAMVYSDISNFKYINDTMGYEVGDHILRQFSRLIRENYEAPQLVSRASSDNFMGILEYESEKALRIKVMEINNRFNREQKERNLNRNLVVISGVSLIRPENEDVTVAIDNANIARKSAKGSMKTVCRFFSEEMEQKMRKEMEIVTSMEKALQDREFVVYLQPKFELKTDRMVGAEALVRWVKQDKSSVKPGEFIPVFEKNGFVVNVDFFVYEEVCRYIRRWLNEGKPVVPISINVSRLHLNDEFFFDNLLSLVERYHIPPQLLELELTESVFLNNTEAAIEIMRKLRKHGFGVSIDDFGAGYSSLNMLKDMETDVIKLDKEFFRTGRLKKEDKIILSNIITMAKQLNMKVLSEGVETLEQSAFLKEVHCDMVQGFLYAKPMPVMIFENLMARLTKTNEASKLSDIS